MELILEFLSLRRRAGRIEVLSGRSSLLRVQEVNFTIMVRIRMIGFNCQTPRSAILHDGLAKIHMLPAPDGVIVIEGFEVFE
jgi:hypothetical protein